MSTNRYQHIKSTRPVLGKARKLKDLMMKSDNRICADCGAPDPKWASATIGVFLCLKCGDVHRALGSDISKVLSITLDEWSDSDIDSMVEVGGNSYANSIYEAFLPKDHPKPKPDSSMEYRTTFIRAKYETQDFLKPSLRISSKSSFKSTTSVKSVASTFSSTSRKDAIEDTREFIGELNIKVVKGTNMAVRDMLTSDPYVILSLGEQKTQTTVKKSDLNPVWNEVLNLSVPRNYGPLKLQVYDHDMFSADDIMGEAEIDLQPMITAAMAFGDTSRLGDMQIGRWFMTKDNALIKDSIVNVVAGKVKQEVHLKLQNVESEHFCWMTRICEKGSHCRISWCNSSDILRGIFLALLVHAIACYVESRMSCAAGPLRRYGRSRPRTTTGRSAAADILETTGASSRRGAAAGNKEPAPVRRLDTGRPWICSGRRSPAAAEFCLEPCEEEGIHSARLQSVGPGRKLQLPLEWAAASIRSVLRSRLSMKSHRIVLCVPSLKNTSGVQEKQPRPSFPFDCS